MPINTHLKIYLKIYIKIYTIPMAHMFHSIFMYVQRSYYMCYPFMHMRRLKGERLTCSQAHN